MPYYVDLNENCIYVGVSNDLSGFEQELKKYFQYETYVPSDGNTMYTVYLPYNPSIGDIKATLTKLLQCVDTAK